MLHHYGYRGDLLFNKLGTINRTTTETINYIINQRKKMDENTDIDDGLRMLLNIYKLQPTE